LRDYAASQKLSEEEALQKGMEAKAVEFVKQGGQRFIKGPKNIAFNWV
jgi:phosphomethylpyrimidine synthase